MRDSPSAVYGLIQHSPGGHGVPQLRSCWFIGRLIGAAPEAVRPRKQLFGTDRWLLTGSVKRSYGPAETGDTGQIALRRVLLEGSRFPDGTLGIAARFG